MSHSPAIPLKRVFDIAVAAAGIVATAIPVVFTAAAMSLANRSSPFYTQTRIGQHGAPFRIYKIKTMRDAFNAEGMPLPDDERTTALGRFIRKTRLDELPQLFNVLKGEMSLVGPRPVPASDIKAFDPLRLTIKPGITGLAQVGGLNGLPHEKILELDHAYVRSHSLLGDLHIMLRSPVSLLLNWRHPHCRVEAPPSNQP